MTYGTRKRVVPAMAAGFACLASLHSLVSNNALAVNFTTSDQDFQIYTNYLEGVVGASFMSPTTTYSGADTGVAELAIKQAHLAGLCLISEASPLPGMPGHSSLVITAGVPVKADFGDNGSFDATDGRGDPVTTSATGALTGQSLADAVTVNDLFLNSDQLTAYGNSLSGLNLGESADQVQAIGTAPWTQAHQPQNGNFGLSAQQLNLADLAGDTYGINLAGSASLPHLKIRIYPNGADQSDCALQAGS
ncbi:DUF6230 family protein [Nocardioides sp.]|uniref:DUF6230 family protein n=1 Tax=Nocardioides sp. TaxID=35761 RepID=UPI0039E4C44A